MKSYYTNKLIKISFLLLCLMAIIINIHAMDNDEDTVTVSRVKYDTIMNENEIMQNEIARLQNLLKSRKRFREVLPTQSAQLGGEDKPITHVYLIFFTTTVMCMAFSPMRINIHIRCYKIMIMPKIWSILIIWNIFICNM